MKYRPLELLRIHLQTASTQSVGKLLLKDRRYYFQYDAEFVQSGLQLSPFKMPLKLGVQRCEDYTFGGMWGVFNDSLPDGWGQLLLDRQLRRQGFDPNGMTHLDRLSIVGLHGMGALIYKPDQPKTEQRYGELDLDQLVAESKIVLEGTAEQTFADLLALNGSSQGARPKVMVGFAPSQSQILYGVEDLPEPYEHWLIKFPSFVDPKDIGSIEFAYHHMAKVAGLEMMPAHLFRTAEGGTYFGAKRFDRNQNERIHMHTACGLLHADHRFPSLDYENLLKATHLLTQNMGEVEKLFRLAAFNVVAHNRDDHSKNVSFLMSHAGIWRVAPAYDLTFSSGPGGEHCMMVCGEAKDPSRAHLLKLANLSGLTKSRAVEMIDQVTASVAMWDQIAPSFGVTKLSQKAISKKLKI